MLHLLIECKVGQERVSGTQYLLCETVQLFSVIISVFMWTDYTRL